jgi:predicted O-methyltransferase YrrM
MLESQFTNKEYFSQFIPERDNLLLELEQQALDENIPIIGPVMGQLLSLLVIVTGSRRVLELGTAIGYSGLHIARSFAHPDSELITIEHSEDRVLEAQQNFENAGLADKINIKTGKALDIMDDLQPSFDLIFIDINKEAYLPALHKSSHLLKQGGLLIADNTSFTGSRKFNDAIQKSREWRSVQLYSFLPAHSPEHDGICLAVKV